QGDHATDTGRQPPPFRDAVELPGTHGHDEHGSGDDDDETQPRADRVDLPCGQTPIASPERRRDDAEHGKHQDHEERDLVPLDIELLQHLRVLDGGYPAWVGDYARTHDDVAIPR